MFGLDVIDVVVIVLYFAVIVVIGAWCSFRIKNEEDYFLAGRGFGKLIQTFAAFGQGTSADNAVGVTTTTFTNGASGVWSSLLYLFNTPIYWLVTPWLRRLRLLTTGDFFLVRYGSQKMAATYAVIGSLGMMAFIALGFNAMTKTIVAITPKSAQHFTQSERLEYQRAVQEQVQQSVDESAKALVLTFSELLERDRLLAEPSDSLDTAAKSKLVSLEIKRQAKILSHISENELIWLVCLVVMVYAVSGGLEAAFLTDTIQGIFILLLSVILIPFGWAKINAIYGGSTATDALETIHRVLPEANFDIFGSPSAVDFTWFYILALSLMAVFTVPVQPNVLVSTGSARDEYTARFGFTVGSFMKRFCTVFWGVFGLAAMVIYRQQVHNPDLVWGYATRDLLGPLNLGLVGLMIASLMAALMSTADCLMLTCSSLLTHNLYKPLRPGRSERHYVWVGRTFGALILIGSVLLATQFDTILHLLKFIWEINVMLAPAFWLGMKWRRANCLGAWTSIVTAGLLFFLLPILAPMAMPQLRTNPYLLKTTDPAPLVRSYTAHEAEVGQRESEIATWDELHSKGEAIGSRPKPLVLGEKFAIQTKLPKKSIFWTQGIWHDEDGVLCGRGRITLEFLLIEWLGFDLSNNSYALNETIRTLVRTFIPFIIMIAVTLSTPCDEQSLVDRFYARMRTKVLLDHDADARELAISLDNPYRYKDRLLFPDSQWELFKWNREDLVGFGISLLAVIGVLGLMTLLVRLGEHSMGIPTL